MEKLKPKLFNYDYWKNNSVFTVTQYDASLYKNGHTTKQIAHCCLRHDITILLNAFPDDKDMKKQISSLQACLKSVHRNPDNIHFWNSAAQKPTARRPLDQPSTSATAIKKLKTKDESSNSNAEDDEIYVKNSILSVGTIIKSAAMKIHDKHVLDKGGASITSRQMAVMKNGLSSILNLADQSQGSQMTLFHADDWDDLVNRFSTKYTTRPAALDPVVVQTWNIVCQAIQRFHDFKQGIIYLYRIYPKHYGKPYFFCLKIFEHILTLMEKCPEIFVQNKNLSEGDVIRLIWSTIFEQLFDNKKYIKIITGETVNSFSTLNKKTQYETQDEIIGFKIDIRIACSVGNDVVDICCGEVARMEIDQKIIDDSSKVCREAKENLDMFIDYIPNAASWSFLIAGSACSISCLYLAANGLYVNIPKFDFHLPASMNDLPDFLQTLQHLLAFRREMDSLAHGVIRKSNQIPSIVRSLGRSDLEEAALNTKLLWKRDTYHSPPPKMTSVVPKHVFGSPFINRIDNLKSVDENNVEGADETTLDSDDAGWAKRGEIWYNVYTKDTSDTNPYED